MVAHDRYNPQRFPHPFRAGVAKSVDAVDSKSTVEIRAGSSPAFGTKNARLSYLRVAFLFSALVNSALPTKLQWHYKQPFQKAYGDQGVACIK